MCVSEQGYIVLVDEGFNSHYIERDSLESAQEHVRLCADFAQDCTIIQYTTVATFDFAAERKLKGKLYG